MVDDSIAVNKDSLRDHNKNQRNYNGKKIVILLPAYNEELTIAETIKDFHSEIPEAEIWIINNRSKDNTELLANKTLKELRCQGGVMNENRPGKGNALRRAFYEIDADVYVLSDADMTYPAYHVHDLIAPVIDNKADMVVGDRHSSGHYANENKRKFHNFGNDLVKKLVNKLFKGNLADIMSGYRALNKHFVKSYPILVEGFEIETDMTLHALDKRFRVTEISVDYRDRPAGSFSKLNTFKDGFKVLNTISSILRYYKPLTFFGLASLAFFALGIISAIPVFNDWINYGYIYHVPLAILSTGLEMVSLILMSIGLILDSINHQDKRNFELSNLANIKRQ
ncbi:glycosyltransferase family 2 protein [Pantoea sp.]|uniref:glycosyltransferase family 2 protein n=1 Tax=Pantoea sp. TaxID=69393 RepID=UPI0025DB78F7|nr:glycosyltransferase family 2 protein [Pantoea sp.]